MFKNFFLAVLSVFAALLSGCGSMQQKEVTPNAQRAADQRGVPVKFGWDADGNKICLNRGKEVIGGEENVRSAEDCVEKIARARDIDDGATIANRSKLQKPRPSLAETAATTAVGAIGAGIVCNIGGKLLGFDPWFRQYTTATCAAAGGFIAYESTRSMPQAASPYLRAGEPGDFYLWQAEQVRRRQLQMYGY